MDLDFEESDETKSGEPKMEQNQNVQGKLIETTDCLEAIGVMRCWKNFLFTILIICLVLSQLAFWLVNTRIIKTEKQSTEEVIMVETKSVDTPTDEQVEEIEAEEAGVEEAEVKDVEAGEVKAVKASKVIPIETRVQKILAFLGQMDFEGLSWLIKLVNFALLLSAILYCLSILFILKVSLVGRLGGINHIIRAFFLSMTVVVLLIPWQFFFKDVLAGMIYTPAELLESLQNAKVGGMMGQIYLYLRYCVYWAIVIFLAVGSQIRSGRWARASLRRLEVV